jgi:hypothetical protein
MLFVTTGDIGSTLARWRGSRWRLIHPPTHLHYFSRETVTRLLSRYGLQVVEIKSVGVARSYRQVAWSTMVQGHGWNPQWAELHEMMNRAFLWREPHLPAGKGFSLNLGDIMFVAAVKE